MRWILFTDRIEMIAENKEDEVLIQRMVEGIVVVSVEGVRFEICDELRDGPIHDSED